MNTPGGVDRHSSTQAKLVAARRPGVSSLNTREYGMRILIGIQNVQRELEIDVPIDAVGVKSAVAEALRREPRLNPSIFSAIAVEDGTVDGWRMVWGAAESAALLASRR